MIEFHDQPNDVWYARQLADGQIVLNPADPEALQKLKRNHPTLAEAFTLEKKRKKALRKARALIRKIKKGNHTAADLDDALKDIDEIEPDVAE